MFLYIVILILGFSLVLIPNVKEARVFGWWLVLFLIFFSSVRYDVGVDFENYQRIFLDFSINNITPRFEPISLMIFKITKFFDFNYNFILFIFAFFTLGGVSYFLSTVQRQYGLSIYIFLTVPIFYFQTFNHLRQWLAIGILYMGFSLLYERKKIRGIFALIVSILTHYSMALPVVLWLFLKQRIPAGQILFYFFLFFCLLLFFREIVVATRYGIYFEFEQIKLSTFYFLFGISCIVMVCLSGYFSRSVRLNEIEILCLNLTFFSGIFLTSCYLLDFGRVISMRVNEVFVLSYIPSVIITLERIFGRENLIVKLFLSLLCSFLFLYTLVSKGEGYKLLPFEIIGFG
jgi:hypothetical protein